VGGPLIISTYDDVLTFDSFRFFENPNIAAAYLSRVDYKGRHLAYQISNCLNLPPFIEEQIPHSHALKIFQEKEIKLINELPLRYITQNQKSVFTENMIKKNITAVLRMPLGRIENVTFFLSILSENDYICGREFVEQLLKEKESMTDKIYAFYSALLTIKNLFLSYRKILELKGDETFAHMERVAVYSHEIALRTWHLANQLNQQELLKKFSPFTFETLKLAATIHDVGKLAIPENILNKPSKLTKEEFEIIKTHSAKGMEILNTAFPTKGYARGELFSKELYAIIDVTKEIIYQHHERMDGTGYPNGLKGHEVGLFSKIVSVADVFDAITSKRIYKAKQSPEIALTEMVKEQYNKYDPLILEALFRTQNKSLLQSIQ